MSDTRNHAGGEHLASVVAWAIEGTHPTRIGYYDTDHLTEAYALMTGTTPPMQSSTNLASVATPVAASATATAPVAVVEPPQ